MRRNYRGRFTERIDTKKMLYIAGTILALAIIAFVITFFIYGNTTIFEKKYTIPL